MIKPACMLTLFLFAGTAQAGDDFDARVARAKKVERSSPVGREYLMRYMPETNATFENIYRDCRQHGIKGKKEIFTVVFDVDAEGRITNIAIAEKDRDEYAQCYAKGLAQIKGPPPPASFAEKGFPVVIQASHDIR